jgi:hypothetical protein
VPTSGTAGWTGSGAGIRGGGSGTATPPGLLGAAAARPPTLRVLLSASDLDELARRLARAEEHHDP